MWLANLAPSFWRGVPTGVSLCQRCYGIGHRARARGKTAQLPGPIPGPPLQIQRVAAQPVAPVADHSANDRQRLEPSSSLRDHNSAPEVNDGCLEEDEYPQSSKIRRTRKEEEDAERRRLEKSLSLYQLPSEDVPSSGRAQRVPTKRLRIDTVPLTGTSSIPACSGHEPDHSDFGFCTVPPPPKKRNLNVACNVASDPTFLHSSNRHSACPASVSEGFALNSQNRIFDIIEREPPNPSSTATAKDGGNSLPVNAVGSAAHRNHTEEPNPVTLRRRPPD